MNKLKLWIMFGLMALMLFACSFSVLAEDSPTSTKEKKKSEKTTSAKTGESSLLIYTLFGAAALGGVAVIAGRKSAA